LYVFARMGRNRARNRKTATGFDGNAPDFGLQLVESPDWKGAVEGCAQVAINHYGRL
jgi:hypothetical protein